MSCLDGFYDGILIRDRETSTDLEPSFLAQWESARFMIVGRRRCKSREGLINFIRTKASVLVFVCSCQNVCLCIPLFCYYPPVQIFVFGPNSFLNICLSFFRMSFFGLKFKFHLRETIPVDLFEYIILAYT